MFQRIRAWWRDLRYCNGFKQANTQTWGIRPWEGAPYLWFVIDRSETARRVEDDMDPPDCDPTDLEDPGYCTYCKAAFELVRPGKSQPTCECWSHVCTDGVATEDGCHACVLLGHDGT